MSACECHGDPWLGCSLRVLLSLPLGLGRGGRPDHGPVAPSAALEPRPFHVPHPLGRMDAGFV